jgi:hypothetical protein
VNCEELVARLTDYSEGAADAELCAAIERHLRECTDCEGVRADLERLSRLCRTCDPPRLPDDARAAIERLLRG